MSGLNDPSFVRILENLITDIVRRELDRAKFWRSMVATVMAVDGDLLDVEIADDGITVESVPNKTSETVIEGDQVYVVRLNNSKTNYVALVKKS